MTNDECQMTKEVRSPNVEKLSVRWPFRHLDFIILSDFVICHSDLGLAVHGQDRKLRRDELNSEHGFPTESAGYFPFNSATAYSRFMRAMKLRLISFGQTASHEPVTVQLPKPSASIAVTMLATRRPFSTLP